MATYSISTYSSRVTRHFEAADADSASASASAGWQQQQASRAAAFKDAGGTGDAGDRMEEEGDSEGDAPLVPIGQQPTGYLDYDSIQQASLSCHLPEVGSTPRARIRCSPLALPPTKCACQSCPGVSVVSWCVCRVLICLSCPMCL